MKQPASDYALSLRKFNIHETGGDPCCVVAVYRISGHPEIRGAKVAMSHPDSGHAGPDPVVECYGRNEFDPKQNAPEALRALLLTAIRRDLGNAW